MPFRPGAQTVPFEACHSASTGSLPCLRHLPVVSGRKPKAACLLRTASAIFPVEPRLFPTPGQSFRDARGILQTWPIQLLLSSYCNAVCLAKCLVKSIEFEKFIDRLCIKTIRQTTKISRALPAHRQLTDSV